jgi:TPR repeat protein
VIPTAVTKPTEDLTVAEFLELGDLQQAHHLNEILRELDKGLNDPKEAWLTTNGVTWFVRRLLRQASQPGDTLARSKIEAGLLRSSSSEKIADGLIAQILIDQPWETEFIENLLQASPDSSLARINRFLISVGEEDKLSAANRNQEEGEQRSDVGEAVFLLNALSQAPSLPLPATERTPEDFRSIYYTQFNPKPPGRGIGILSRVLAKRPSEGVNRIAYIRNAVLYALANKPLLDPSLLRDVGENVRRINQAEVAIQAQFGKNWRSIELRATTQLFSATEPDRLKKYEDALAKSLTDGDPGSEIAERLFLRGLESQQNGRDGRQQFELAAREGNAVAAFFLGFDSNKNGDLAEAFRWYLLAAKRGNVPAMTTLAPIYKFGSGIPIDKTEALRWRQAAAWRGDTESMFWYANALALGEDVKQNDEEATRWFERAATQGHVDACMITARRYFDGVGVAENKNDALKWFIQAGDFGESDGYFAAAQIHLMGIGMARAPEKGIALLKKAADSGNSDAMSMLGEAYSTGLGVPKDENLAREWRQKALEKKGRP